ncbi:S-layer homology domain-containing protein [Demequina soli]|uniref:S-layer homology domain-containing protein n=1 Tax=Demequina soli TaxID=1638987 RepID=UPI00078592F6|nr:S-layer homology domain-containing protein [Demequina soli]
MARAPRTPRRVLASVAATVLALALPVPALAATDPSPTPAVDDAAVASPDPTPAATDAPAPTPITTATPAPTPTPTPTPKSTPTPSTKPSAKPSSSPAPAPTAEPEASTAPADGGPSEPAPSDDAATSAPATPDTSAPSASAAPADPMVAYDPATPASSSVRAPAALDPVTFDDVSDDLEDAAYSPFAADVAWMGRAGIDAGVRAKDGTLAFRPDAVATRAELAGFLYRFAGSPGSLVPAASPFRDVTRDGTAQWREIEWLAARGVDVGREAGEARRFDPDAAVTRADLARWLYRFAGEPAVDPAADVYVDVPRSSDLHDAVTWLARQVAPLGWDTAGGREFRPDATLTRGAVAAVLHLARDAKVRPRDWDAPVRLVDAATVTVDAAGGLHLRRGPSTDAVAVAGSDDGATLDTTGAYTSNGWAQVRVDGALLWASMEYLAVPSSSRGQLPAPTDPVAVLTTGSAAGVTHAALASSYENGHIPRDVLCPIPWQPAALLVCHAVADLESLDAAFRDRWGMHIPVGGGYRDYAGQLASRARYGWMAAVPGTSNHGWGEAIDLAGESLPGGYDGEAYRWLIAALPEHGWTLPTWARPDGTKPEPWHLEHVG